MQQHLCETAFDAVIHSAAVSDHLVAGVYAPTPWTRFDEEHTWQGSREKAPTLVDRAAGKVKSDEPELWLRLVRAPKLVDRIRQDWGFKGILVKFKLEVGPSDKELLNIAEQSRLLSQANLIVANTLEGASTWAYLGSHAEGFVKVPRPELASRLLDALEHLR
jgi:phosphopantothenoylcysteine synthetase/decarboxylase